eukprot:2941603-Rhodomonas_salina.2
MQPPRTKCSRWSYGTGTDAGYGATQADAMALSELTFWYKGRVISAIWLGACYAMPACGPTMAAAMCGTAVAYGLRCPVLP